MQTASAHRICSWKVPEDFRKSGFTRQGAKEAGSWTGWCQWEGDGETIGGDAEELFKI